MPDTRLILHVKGTESQTTELPKEEVKAAVLEGKLSQSQLIWSPQDNAWKQVRELPDLAPGETLILHVKGTEAQTQELPKEVVRNAIAQGKISQSQLIWSAAENTWKQVREWPDLAHGETLILHVKGTETGTTELPKKAIRAGISKGDITHSQLIWSSAENQWKQVRQMPELLPSQKLAPAPTRSATPPRVLDGIMPDSPQNPVARAASAVQAPPKVKVALAQPRVADGAQPAGAQPRVAAATGTPKVRVAAASSLTPVAQPSVAQPTGVKVAATAPKARVMAAGAAGTPNVRAAAVALSSKRGAHHVVKEEEGPHFLKWICLGMGALIVLLIGANYFLVDRALQASMRGTAYSDVSVHAHYGAFIQPNVIVIHIPASAKLTPNDFTDFLVELAHSTPDNPISGGLFTRVALTSGWTAQYSFSGYSWKQLGDMDKESPAEREEFIMSQMGDASGQSILPESTLSPEAQEPIREKKWEDFEDRFMALK